MGKYVIKCGRKYVAMPGSKHSYTTSLRNARKFSSREEAQGNACGNERVVAAEDEI